MGVHVISSALLGFGIFIFFSGGRHWRGTHKKILSYLLPSCFKNMCRLNQQSFFYKKKEA